MVDARELRIGNWVEPYMVLMSGAWYDKEGVRHGTDIITEPSIRKKQIDVNDLRIISESHGLATYRPIPLSTDILLKCGFVLNDEQESFDLSVKNCGMISLHNDDYSVSIFDSHSDYGFTPSKCPINTVHKLQNLYYALTNTELEIKL